MLPKNSFWIILGKDFFLETHFPCTVNVMLTGFLPEPRTHKHCFFPLLHESQTPLLHGSSSLDGLLSGCYKPTHRVHDNTHGVHMIGESSTTRKG